MNSTHALSIRQGDLSMVPSVSQGYIFAIINIVGENQERKREGIGREG
jgi:hypothetical protein